MESRRLEHFVAVAEERSFTRAAARLHIVQSGISASVQALEKELGSRLFERTTQHVELTEAGRALLPEARRVLQAVRSAREVVSEVRSGLRGTLGFGVLFGMTPSPVFTALARFRAEYPLVEVRLAGPAAGGTAEHAESLRGGALDLAVLMTTGPLPGLRLHTLSSESLRLACTADHPLAAREEVELAEVLEHGLIDFPVGWGIRAAADRAFTVAGLGQRRVSFEMNDMITVVDLVRHGLGVVFLPPDVAERAPDLRLLPVRGPLLDYRIVLATPEDRPLQPTARAFRRTLLDLYQR